MSQKYVYIYLDPDSLEVRYVGSGTFYRMLKHTCPFNLARETSPFIRWLRERTHVQWRYFRFRIIGPVSEKIAHIWEQALILEHFETTLNVRAVIGCELSPAIHERAYGPRSESGFAKQAKREYKKKVDLGVFKIGNGIYQYGDKWRVTFQIEDKQVIKEFSTCYEVLEFRQNMKLKRVS